MVRDNSYCCLGVACKLLGTEQRELFFVVDCTEYVNGLPDTHVEKLGLCNDEGSLFAPVGIKGKICTSLTELNDIAKLSFKEIAEYICKNKENVFIKS